MQGLSDTNIGMERYCSHHVSVAYIASAEIPWCFRSSHYDWLEPNNTRKRIVELGLIALKIG